MHRFAKGCGVLKLQGCTRRALTGIAALVFAATASAAAADPGWTAARLPTPSPPQVYGGYARGCIDGALSLPLDGPGYQVMRPSRQRFYGHPSLIAFVEQLATEMQAKGWNGLLIGDLAQPRGGPMTSGHRSHQTGLDVDIWLMASPGRTLTFPEREDMPAVSMVAASGLSVDHALWSAAQLELVHTAATFPGVERIFVNAAIKQELCRTVAGDRSWLAKVRAWWGHDDHIHVRLRCPETDSQCETQSPVPSGDGCDASLDWWFSQEARDALRTARAAPSKPMTLEDLPSVCRAVLAGE
jgi:penicillin-insensitive murein DD-endopeptidase